MSNISNKTRRTFLKETGLLSAAFFASHFSVWGKSVFSEGFPMHNIPQVKNINANWLKSLYERGAVTTYLKSRNELKFIGMPVGGLHSGTVYLGGDGRLWLWQIYNESMEPTHEGIDPKTVQWNDGTAVREIRSRDGSAYIEPAIADQKRVLEQGFAIRLTYKGKTIIKELNEESWDEVSFEASYPIGTVKYESQDFPVSVLLRAYSPFIPLDTDHSSLPATVIRLHLQNKTNDKIEVDLLGWMENGVNKLSSDTNKAITRYGQAESTGNYTAIHYGSKTADVGLQDSGTMSFMLHSPQGNVNTDCNPWPLKDEDFTRRSLVAEKNGKEKMVGSIGLHRELAANGHLDLDYSICWHFNNPHPKLKELVSDAKEGYYYGTRFANSKEVGEYLSAKFDYLSTTTEQWQETWKDSTLPFWFLERSMINIGTLATTNTYRFASGRFWGWEGIGACPGTCTHVWQYAQAVARVFPALERDLRERVDLGVALTENGGIIFRAENESRPAIDGQAGTILRFYREHQMNTDDVFLKNNWPKIKKTVEFMFAQDKNGDGMTDTPMENTLDAVWEGEIAWIVGLCIAAARAAQAMAEEVGDQAFAKQCEDYVRKGRKNMEEHLFNGQYFIHRADPVQGRKKLGSYNTCHIDQVYGQAWTFQLGLPRVLDKEKTMSALQALWKYNFTMDVGPYIKTHVGGRPYALAGEGGMIMNTNPLNEPRPYGEDVTWQMGYFHESMSGFEHQVAAHMVAEGMVDEGLVLTRIIHDRYHAAKRNPYNEIECSDHYARAMASYGTFISACGFEYHGPKGNLAFFPRLQQESFRAPFTSAQGWGTYSQEKQTTGQKHRIALNYGTLKLNELGFEKIGQEEMKAAKVTLKGKELPSRMSTIGKKISISLKDTLVLQTGESLEINLV